MDELDQAIAVRRIQVRALQEEIEALEHAKTLIQPPPLEPRRSPPPVIGLFAPELFAPQPSAIKGGLRSARELLDLPDEKTPTLTQIQYPIPTPPK